MRLSFRKSNAPSSGNIFLCDPLVAATLNGLVNITSDITPFAQGLIESGMSDGMTFMMNIFKFDVIESNRLHIADANDGTTSITDAVYNVAMNIMDDNTKPIMGAWRRKPKVEGERNKDLERDEFVVRARYGFGVQRMDTLGVICTSSTAFE